MLQQATTSFKRCLSAKGLFSSLKTFALLSLSLVLVACGGEGERPTFEFVVEKDGLPPTLGKYFVVDGSGNAVEREGELTVTNKCNFSPRIALNDTIIVRIDASESLRKPLVTILGEDVVMSGQNHQWSGEFVLTEGPVRDEDEIVATAVTEFIKNKTSSPIVEVTSVFTAESGLNLSDNEMSELVTALESEFKVSLPDPELESGLINTVQQVINVIQSTDLEIPVTVSFEDISGEKGDAELTESKKLRFCEQNCKCFPDDISGTWENRNEVNSMGVGPEEGSTIFWNINNFELGRRGCVFDDEYLFGPQDEDIDETGSFAQSMGDETWLESWISPDGKETCGTPIAPFDGSGTDHTYIWDPENKKLSVKGLGAHIGIPRIQNESSAQNETVEKIVYNVSTASTCVLILDIKGVENWWHFELEKIKDSNGEDMTPAKCDATGGSSGGADADQTLDTDGDGVPDFRDMFPNDSTESLDTDFDGIGNVADTDDDGDGVKDSVDCAPLDKNVRTCASGSGTDSGSGSGSSDDSASSGFDLTNATAVPVVIEDQFGGAFISDSGSYSVPTGSETWAGFTVVSDTEDDVLPLTFGSGGQITFGANVEGNSNVDVRFRFEKAPATDTDVTPTIPSYTIEPKNLSSGEGEYTVNIPSLGSKTFSSMIFYIDAQNVSLSLSDIVIKETPAAQGTEAGPLAFVNTFGGAQIPADSEFLMPEGSVGAGFSIDKSESGANTDTNPLYFGNGGYISFVGSVPDGGDVDVKFEVQFDEYPNTTPNYMTDVVTVSGAAEKNYSVSIPEQFDNGYKMVIAWLETYDTTVVMKEIMVGVTAQGAAKVGATEPALFTGPFEGAEYDAESNTYTFPASAKSYAGYSNDNANLYPMTFDVGGCVTFNASAETAVSIRYKFERQPYPANTPEMFTEYVTVSGTVQEYTLDVPPSATAGNTYSSFLLFIDANDRDLPVVITDVVATNTGACGTD
jgi:acyl carrier protein